MPNLIFKSVLNFASSVCLVFLTKRIFENGFTFPFALLGLQLLPAAMHHCLYASAQSSGPDIPFGVKLLVSALSIVSNSLSITSILLNPLYVYQICKILVMPFTVISKAFIYNERTDARAKLHLAVMCIGVLLTSVATGANNRTLNLGGIIAGLS